MKAIEEIIYLIETAFHAVGWAGSFIPAKNESVQPQPVFTVMHYKRQKPVEVLKIEFTAKIAITQTVDPTDVSDIMMGVFNSAKIRRHFFAKCVCLPSGELLLTLSFALTHQWMPHDLNRNGLIDALQILNAKKNTSPKHHFFDQGRKGQVVNLPPKVSHKKKEIETPDNFCPLLR